MLKGLKKNQSLWIANNTNKAMVIKDIAECSFTKVLILSIDEQSFGKMA